MIHVYGGTDWTLATECLNLFFIGGIMTNATLIRPENGMAKKSAKSADVNVRITAEAARLARMVASFEERNIADIVSEIVVPVLKRRYEEHLKKAQQELAAESKPKR